LEGRSQGRGLSDTGQVPAEVAQEPWTVRPYRPGDEGQILALFKKVFGVERSLEHWHWKFRDNPGGGTHIYLAVTASGRIVGQYAGLPVLMRWDGETLRLTQIIDVMVAPDFRAGLKKPGMFVKLADGYIRGYGGPGRTAGGFGFPPPLALRIGRLVGYTDLHNVQQLAKSLQDAPSPAWSRPIASWQWVVEEVRAFDGRADRLWTSCSSELPLAAIRDARYLNWRYARHPEVHYRLFIIRRRLSDEWAGLAVLRLGCGKATAYLGQGEEAACLVDWLMPLAPQGPAELLLARCEAIAREAGMKAMYTWFRPDSSHWRLFLELGFRPEPTPMHFVALRCIDTISLEWARDCWYYTMGDSDLY